VTQGEWTSACDDVVTALVGLKISKRRAIDLVRRAAGTTQQEILGNALKIHGQSRTQPMTGGVNGHAIGSNASTQVAPTSAAVQKPSIQSDAIAALIVLGIPEKQATALIQSVPGNTKEQLIRGALQVLRQGRTK
jgi:hypothetical protein